MPTAAADQARLDGETPAADAPRFAIGVDVGGTRIKLGLVDLASGEVRESRILPTMIDGPDEFARLIAAETLSLLDAAGLAATSLAGIGIGMPGYVEDDRVITLPGSLAGLEGLPLAPAFARHLGLPLRFDNDARLVALGEYRRGGHPPARRFLSLTLGTGVGLGMMVDGRLREATAIDHLGAHFPIRPGARACYCGFSGCFETLACAGRLAEDAARLGLESPEALFASPDPASKAAVSAYLADLSVGINALAYIMAPDQIVLGGGIAAALRPYLRELEHSIFARPVPTYTLSIRITPLAEKAGIVGAACQFQD